MEGKSANVPLQQRPRDLRAAPGSTSCYTHPIVTATSSSFRLREQETAPEQERVWEVEPLGGAPGGSPRKAPLGRGERASHIHRHSPHSDLRTSPVSLGTDDADINDRTAPVVSELSKFNPTEHAGLLALRGQLLRCVSGLDGLRNLVLEDDGAGCGLPFLREGHRNRLDGFTFSREDARQELGNETLLERMHQYIEFVECALAADLDEPHPVGLPQPGAAARPESSQSVRPPSVYHEAPVVDVDVQEVDAPPAFTTSDICTVPSKMRTINSFRD